MGWGGFGGSRRLRTEVKRLSARARIDEAPVTLIAIAVVDASNTPEPMDMPEKVGHTMSYRIEGENATFFFPFSQMDSEQAEELAQAIIAHTRKTERAGRNFQVGVMDLAIASEYAIWLTAIPAGTPTNDYAADLYQQVISNRRAVPASNALTAQS